MAQPKLFIGSSSESADVAESANVILDRDFEVTLWKNAFNLSSTASKDLIVKASSVDFALFVFSPDDLARIREADHHVARDNVVFELGVFIGSIGLERCFILKPRNENMHLPSDLSGVTFADFEANRSDHDLQSAVSAACTKVKGAANELGVVTQTRLSERERLQANPPQYSLEEHDYEVLAACLESQTDAPEGLPFFQLKNKLRSFSESILRISLIKLERMSLISKSICSDEQFGNDFYSFGISEDGVDILLKNADRVRKENDQSDDDEWDEEIPF